MYKATLKIFFALIAICFPIKGSWALEGCRVNNVVYTVKIRNVAGTLGGNRPQYSMSNPLPVITGTCPAYDPQKFARVTHNSPYFFTENCGFTSNFDNNGPNFGGYAYGHTVYYDVVNCTLDNGLLFLIIPVLILTGQRIRNRF